MLSTESQLQLTSVQSDKSDSYNEQFKEIETTLSADNILERAEEIEEEGISDERLSELKKIIAELGVSGDSQLPRLAEISRNVITICNDISINWDKGVGNSIVIFRLNIKQKCVFYGIILIRSIIAFLQNYLHIRKTIHNQNQIHLKEPFL